MPPSASAVAPAVAASPTPTQDPAFPCSLTINLPFPTARLAHIARRALAVDAELSPLVRRILTLTRRQRTAPSAPKLHVSPRTGGALHYAPYAEAEKDGTPDVADDADGDDGHGATVLTATYTASTNRMLRVAVNGFFESVGVVLACMRELDVDVVEEEWVGAAGAEVGDGMADGAQAVAEERELRELSRVQGVGEAGVLSVV